MPDAPSPPPPFRPLFPEERDQGDPFALVAPPDSGARRRYYVYTTGEDPVRERAFPVYASDDLRTWEPLGEALRIGHRSSHWAPCVRYLPDLPRPWVMLYSRAIGFGEEGHVGHAIRRADALAPEGPFADSGEVLTPDLDFAIDPDVYRLPDGSLKIAFARDFVDDEPYGTGIVEADLAEDLSALRSAPRVLARPRHEWHVYDPARVMPWKTIPGIDWSRRTVRWHTVEAPVGGIVSPAGRSVYLYSGGNFAGFYAVGALVDGADGPRDVADGATGFVVRPDAARGFYGPGHCSLFRVAEDEAYLMLHARFGAPDARRQMCLAALRWDADDLPVAVPVP